MNKSVFICFGGRSAEHWISIQSALEALDALDPERWEGVPVYFDTTGRIWLGEPLRERGRYRKIVDKPEAVEGLREVKVEASPSPSGFTLLPVEQKQGFFGRAKVEKFQADVVLPVFHGTFGEDGIFQGLLEWCGTPCAGCNSLAAAAGMNKHVTKTLAQAAGVPVLPWRELRLERIEPSKLGETEAAIRKAIGGYPWIVKPANMGSSVGVHPVKRKTEFLAAALDIRSRDTAALVEPFLEQPRELNISVITFPELRLSAIESPRRDADAAFLSSEQKYQRGAKGKTSTGTQSLAEAPRVIHPDWMSPQMAEQIRADARMIAQALDVRGVSRLDFMVDAEDRVFFNEINTIPGSLAHYLWAEADPPLTFTRLLDHLLDEALAEHEKAQNLTRFKGELSYE